MAGNCAMYASANLDTHVTTSSRHASACSCSLLYRRACSAAPLGITFGYVLAGAVTAGLTAEGMEAPEGGGNATAGGGADAAECAASCFNAGWSPWRVPFLAQASARR